MLPDPKYYGKTATKEQLNTLQELFKINNDGTLLPNWNIEIIEKQFRKKRKWHSRVLFFIKLCYDKHNGGNYGKIYNYWNW